VAKALGEALTAEVASKADLREEAAPIKADIQLLKWMIGFSLASTAAILLKSFLG